MSLITNLDNIYKKGVIGNVRKAQEDSHDIFLKTPNGDVFVVCDGMGGHVGGAVASSTAVKSIKEYLEKEKYPTPIEALNGALQFANMQILGYTNDHPELKGMGTTACIVLLQDDEAWIAHVGDSRIYLYLGKEKKLHRITKDHSFVQTLVDAGQITDEEAEHHPNKNRILKALGIQPVVEPTFNYQSLAIRPKNGDVFMICSDGLSGMIPDSTIERVLSEKELTLAQKGDMLIDLAMEGETVQPGGQDNCTLELLQIDNSPWKESEFKSYNPNSSGGEPKRIEGGDDSSKKSSFSPKLLAAIIVGILVLGVGAWLLLSNGQAKKQEVEAIQSRIATLQEEIEILENEKNDKVNEIIKLERECDSLENKYVEAKKTLNSYFKNYESKNKKLGSKDQENKQNAISDTTLYYYTKNLLLKAQQQRIDKEQEIEKKTAELEKAKAELENITGKVGKVAKSVKDKKEGTEEGDEEGAGGEEPGDNEETSTGDSGQGNKEIIA